jgi:two-component system chemotaxis response regulator CheY
MKPMSSMTFLVVDDYPMMQELLMGNLVALGVKESHILTSDHGSQALEVLGDTQIDFVISDWRMPRMNGVELLKAVRADNLVCEVYFMIITGVTGQGALKELLNHGLDSYVIKPYSLAQLEQGIQYALNARAS